MSTYVVTGASRGLGFELTELLAEKGHQVFALSRQSLSSRDDARIVEIQYDLGDVSSISAAASLIGKEAGTIDGLVLNAFGWITGLLAEHSDDDFEEFLRVSLGGMQRTVRAFLPLMNTAGRATIVVVSSTAAIPPSGPEGSSVTFVTAKYAQAGFAIALDQELAGSGVRVSTIYPSGFSEDSHPGRMLTSSVAKAVSFCFELPPDANLAEVIIRPTDGR